MIAYLRNAIDRLTGMQGVPWNASGIATRARLAGEHARAIEPLALLAVVEGGVVAREVSSSPMREEYLSLRSEFSPAEIVEAAESDQQGTMDRRYWKHLHSWHVASHDAGRRAEEARCRRALEVVIGCGMAKPSEIDRAARLSEGSTETFLSGGIGDARALYFAALEIVRAR